MKTSLLILAAWLLALPCSNGQSGEVLGKMGVYDLLDLAAARVSDDLDSAFAINDLALQKARASHDGEAVFYTLRERGIYFEQYNRPKDALPEYERALASLDSLSARAKYQPIIWNDLAIVSRKTAAYVSCLDYHERALQLAVANHDLELEEDSYHGIGFLYETLGKWEKAIEFYQKSVAIAEQRKSVSGVATSFQNIANVLQKSGNQALALEKIEAAWQMAQGCDSTRQAHVLYDYGEILVGAGRSEEALAKFQSALYFYQKTADERAMIGRSLLSIANAYNQLGKDALALAFFQKALSMREFIRPEDLANLWNDYGTLCLELGKTAEARSIFGDCLRLAEQYDFQDYRQKSHQALAQILEKQGDAPGALAHLNRALALKDSIFAHEAERRIVESEFLYRTAKKEETIVQLRARNNKFIFAGAALVAGLLAAFMLFLYRQKAAHNHSLNRKNAEIEQRNKRLQESNQVLQQFAYATAHDLKEPLRTISAVTGLLQKKHSTEFSPDAQARFEHVKSAAVHMDRLLGDLLKYSTIFMATPDGQTCIAAGLGEATKNLSALVRQRGAAVDLPEDLPGLSVRMQPGHFVQLFQNLIENGIKFAPENPRVAISVVPDGGVNYLFRVQDNGIGIAENHREKIFQIFQRLDRQRFEGAGMGLAICKNIVEKYDGAIWFESEPGQGTTFFVRLPASLSLN